MGVQKLIEKLIPVDDLMETVKRFPLSVFCSICLFIIGIGLIHDFIDDKDEWLGRLCCILGCCYFWFGISKLMAEAQGWSLQKYLTVSFVVAGGIAALFSFATLWGIHLLFVLPALLLCLMIAPYLTGGDDLSFWFFNRTVWFGVIVSYAALIMFAGGLSIALAAIHTLFDVKIEEEVYADIWTFAALVLGPLYALSWVPEVFEYTEEDCTDPPGLRFIANWISPPMVFIYLLILYAYFIKITVSGDIPNGHLAYMISGFAGAGVVTYLIAWPLREVGSAQLKLFYKIFFPALLIPVGYHFYAIWERVGAYGITEQRYMLLVSAVWFLMIAVSNSFFKGKMPLKAIPMTLAILMVFASFGPWGGVSVSGYSQFSRMEGLLLKNNILVNGEIVKAEEDLSFEDRQNISSIIDYLCQSGRDAMIEPWFNTEGKEEWDCYSGSKLTEQLGFEYVSAYKRRQDNEHFYLNANYSNYIDISRYDVMFQDISIYHYNRNNDKAWKNDWAMGKDSEQHLSMEYKDGVLKVFIPEMDAIYINLTEFAKEKSQYKDNHQVLVIESENNQVAYNLVFRHMNGQIIDGEPSVHSAGFDFMYRIK